MSRNTTLQQCITLWPRLWKYGITKAGKLKGIRIWMSLMWPDHLSCVVIMLCLIDAFTMNMVNKMKAIIDTVLSECNITFDSTYLWKGTWKVKINIEETTAWMIYCSSGSDFVPPVYTFQSKSYNWKVNDYFFVYFIAKVQDYSNLKQAYSLKCSSV